MIEIRNIYACPSCKQKTELMTFYSSYSKFHCQKCGANLRLANSKKYNYIKFFLQFVSFPILVLGYLILADKDDYLVKFAWLIGCLTLSLTIENFVSRLGLRKSKVEIYES